MWCPDARTTVADIHIYLETPVRLAVPWARANVLVVNPEWFPAVAWDWTLAAPGAGGGMDTVVFKSRAAAALFPELAGKRRSLVIPWRSDIETGPVGGGERWSVKERRFLYVIGGSPCKTLAARSVVASWRAEWPPLEIWCSPGVATVLRPLVPSGARVEFQTEYRPAAEREARQRACAWHVVVSAAEGFGMTAAEAVACGAPMLWGDLPVLRETWGYSPGCVAMAPVERGDMPELPGVSDSYRRSMREGLLLPVGPEAIVRAVEQLLALTEEDMGRICTGWRAARSAAMRGFRSGWERVAELAWRVGAGRKNAGLPVAPAVGTAPPHVAVVTLTRGRQREVWWPVMRENVRRQRWPAARLEWIVVGEPGGDPLEPVVREWARSAPFVVRWTTVGEEEEATVGAKRNAGVRAASAAASVFVMMDDDDHYPESSVATRVSWLTGRGAVYCSTLPMYDLRRYVSAINVPPQIESPAERVSEATLAFRREFWEARGFPDVGMAEGCGFLDGSGAERIRQTAEIPPAGVIVSFIHGGNSSSRRVPAEQEPNGCHWGFSDEYFELVHRVAATR
jgi:hypothetical protein